MSRVCHLCGTSIPDGAEYCPACGASCSDKASGPEARNSRGLVAVIVSCIAIIVCAAVVGCLWFFKVGPFASAEKVVVQLEDIPDEAFRAYLAANVDTNETGAISEEEVAAAVAFGTAGEPTRRATGSVVWGSLTSRESSTLPASRASSVPATTSRSLISQRTRSSRR